MTFMFTDIEGSTVAWEEHPSAMRVALARHDSILAGAIDAAGGVVFSTGGDGLAAAFSRAHDAVQAALAVQQALGAERWPDGLALLVRMGLQTGEAEERDGDYFGPPLNRAARIMALAAGGEVLLGRTTADLVQGQLDDGVYLVDVGEWELRSVARPEHVYQLVWQGDQRSARSPIGRVGNLPRVRRPLIGREVEDVTVTKAIADSPLVTLVGVGGVGKTSLAISVGQELAAQRRDGAWLCELSAVFERDAVAHAIAETLGLRPQGTLPSNELVVRALSNLDCLVILDNCEHVLDAVGELVEGIVRRCPHTSILATSREALGVAGERIVPLRPLGPQDAGALFWERAVGLGASLPDDADALVAQLCRQLDGLPLAIELAAARTIAMPLADLVARLGERFRLLRGQRRAIERHQTLRATVAWSYDLLETGERRVFEWLSVFSGSFDLDAAQTVCRHEDSDALDVVEHVVSLAEKSMVVLSPDGRYTLLETLRQFGEERLGSDGKADCCREAHAAYFENLVRTAHDGLQGPDETKWWARLQQDWANIRGAFHWAVQRGDIERAAAIATNLIWAACYHDTGEPFVWIDVVGSMPDVERSGQLASVRGGQAWAAWERGDMGHALRLGHEAIEAEGQGERERNRDNMAEFSLYSAAYFLNDRETTERFLARSLTRARAEDLKAVESTDLNSYAIVANGAREPTSRHCLGLARHGRWQRRSATRTQPHARWSRRPPPSEVSAIAPRRPRWPTSRCESQPKHNVSTQSSPPSAYSQRFIYERAAPQRRPS